ncbi:MAG: tRNA epoxyqueuosine(34) reductase QueG [Porticoccaceae bacterium]|nr:tRNA epoxyqueuosine(34) reductase QueG [Porticoccaceae bacterium]
MSVKQYTPAPTGTTTKDLRPDIRRWGHELGFQQVGFTHIDLEQAGERLQQWLAQGFNGSMQWLAEHGEKRWRPELLLPGTVSIISVRMDYLSPNTDMIARLKDGDSAYLSRYALGRDYHKLIRKRLSTLAKRIEEHSQQPVIQRPFVDSAPVMEKPIAEQAGLGWIGKHTLVLNREAGSWFFLGELYTSLELPADTPAAEKQCGNCRACLKICPTQAFPEPYVLDARRCISYLTIENKGPIPLEFRQAIGNRVFGCDDCQIICPWNRFAKATEEDDFRPRHSLDNIKLSTLFQWSEEEFLQRTAGSPIRRIGHERWQRNLAIGLGNAPASDEITEVLKQALPQASALVGEHIQWALGQQQKRNTDGTAIDIN